MITIGSKIQIIKSEIDAFVGQVGFIEGHAPDSNDQTIYKVRVGDMILPGWIRESEMVLMNRPYSTLIFDLDGCLTDSGVGIMRCAQYALEKFGIDVPVLERLRPFVGPPLEDSFKQFFGFSDEDAAKAVQHYRERYFSRGKYEQHLYPEIPEFLKHLRKNGYRLAIATSKTINQTLEVLEWLGISKCFDNVAARDEQGILHTKADVINSLLGSMGLNNSKRSCVMIGDRKYDIEGARQAGIDSIGVLWGYGDYEELKAAGATHIVETLEDLSKII